MFENLKDIDEHRKILTGSIFLVLISGVFPSVWASDWNWFSRSGALLVIYGIYIAWQDYKGGIDSDLDIIESVATKKFGDKTGGISSTIKNMRISNKKLYNKIEFLIFAFGTAIWGYGDLVGKLYN